MESLEAGGAESPRLYNSTIIQTFLKFVRSKYLFVNIGELLNQAGMEAYQVEDEGHWFTQDQVDRFHESLVRVTGNKMIARDAGRHTSSKEAMDFLTRYAIGLTGPAGVFEKIGDVTKRYTRSADYRSRKASKTEFELTVTPHAGVHEKEYQCQNRIGYFEAIVHVFNSRLPKVEHPECVFRGDPCCRYKVTWRESAAQSWKTARNVVVLSSAVVLPLAFFLAGPLFPGLAVAWAGALLTVALVCSALEKAELRHAVDSLRTTTDQLFDHVNQNYEQALMINEIGRIIGKYIQIDTLLPQVIEVLRRRLDYDRGLILLASADGTRLEYRTGFGYSQDVVDELSRESLHLDRPESRGVFVLCHREKRPFLINDATEIQKDLSERSRRFLLSIGSKSFLCCPILHEDRCLGVLAVDNIKTKRPIRESDLNLLMGIAPEIGISVHNAQLTDDRQAQLSSMVRVLAASIDAVDPLTAGHSERVTEFAVQICTELGIDAEYTEVVRVAAQFHDYGKIGIDRDILRKNGPLTEPERREIETHAAKTEQILSQVKFSGAFTEVPFIAGSHHEWMDGTGYPRGLAGKKIPYGARVIAVADFFEAITAKRHYREPMGFDQAVGLLIKESGAHLDPQIVEAFLRVLSRTHDLSGCWFPAPAGDDRGVGEPARVAEELQKIV